MTWVFWCLIILGPASLFDLAFILSLSSRSLISITLVSQILLMGYGYYRIKKMDINNLFFVVIESQKGTNIVKEMWEEVILILGAFCLLLPGYSTAAIGLILLFKPTRLILLEIIEQAR